MKTEELHEVLEQHKKWLAEEGGKRADLRGANLDFSVWPLWCGTQDVVVDIKLVRQLLAHVCAVKCDDPEFDEVKELIMPYAVKSHRASDLGLKGN